MTSVSDIINSFPASVDKLTEDDLSCLDEIRSVLLKFGKTERFGVNMLHKHFDINDDEVLIETHDASTKTMTTSAKKQKQNDFSDLRETSWYLGKSVPVALGKCRDLWHKEEV